MIQASELRIGNYIYRPNLDGKEYIDYENGVIGMRNVSLSIVQVTGILPGIVILGEDKRGVEWLSPIPLTNELLLKCGFERDRFAKQCFVKDYSKQGNLIIFTNKTPVAVENNIKEPFYYMLNGLIHTIEYAHQLQNLYFAITRKELEVKLC
ncbi:hypothetical protein M2451_002540 [Dysgonomonas sp. PFB1-18]|uniref:hypothetical protein n=1 Tax=unclassified Dysgonomonas TaxID=2630389 RepID=UPI00247348A5|nr:MULTISPECIES: hypothetical protein [unclassified Dysgonomonas]MDH6308021.1 hypothetical protein [Dysgonomonas sp. PF1-14]MDH6339560.1 hypothetical protein [Dysgonomonas sp. PF1-16]MDH6381211.1 hypothetical protein [Dysgonomonas sp. PFB1-18]MDH6398423.1 hypothetical protein [Dysgonomonas sp. PF1-23]